MDFSSCVIRGVPNTDSQKHNSEKIRGKLTFDLGTGSLEPEGDAEEEAMCSY